MLFVPTLGAKERHVRPAMKFLAGANVHYYWDSRGSSMKLFGRSIDMDIEAWDLWTIYARGTKWIDESPPAPAFWQHQLTGLPKEKRLDVDVFVDKIKHLRSALR